MYAIIATGGKQYKVQKDDILKVELLEQQIDETVKLPVIMINNDGKLLAGKDVEKAYVNAKVTYQGKGPKIDIFTYKAKKNIRKRQGHRQPYTEIQILDIKTK